MFSAAFGLNACASQTRRTSRNNKRPTEKREEKAEPQEKEVEEEEKKSPQKWKKKKMNLKKNTGSKRNPEAVELQKRRKRRERVR